MRVTFNVGTTALAPAYRIIEASGTEYQTWTTTGVTETSPGIYGVSIPDATLAGRVVEWRTNEATQRYGAEEFPGSQAVTFAAPSGGGLVSLAEVKAYLNVTDTSSDTMLTQHIEAASAAIRDYCKRRFDAPSVTDTRSVYCNGICHPAELVSVTSVTDADGATYTDWSLSALGGFATLASGTYTITGTWGLSEIPAPVRQACLATVRAWFYRDGNAFVTIDASGGMLEAPEGLPVSVRGMLAPHRWVTL